MILPLSRLPTPIPTRHKIGCPHAHLHSSCFGLLRKYAPRCALPIQPTLFGDLSFIRSWDRIRTIEGSMMQTFDS